VQQETIAVNDLESTEYRACQLAETVLQLSRTFISAKRRCYDSATDWHDGRTHVEGLVAYAIWDAEGAENPIYVGQTRNLGKRLWEHWHSNWTLSSQPTVYLPTHVSYISDSALSDDWTLSALERFLMAVWRPIFNDPKK
jgi:hypothetical protein